MSRVTCVPEELKIEEIKGLDRLKIMQNQGLGSSLGGLGRLWRNLGQGFSENRRQDEPKMSEVSVKLDQERPKLAHVGVKMATWCSTWILLDRFGIDFWSMLGSGLDISDL